MAAHTCACGACFTQYEENGKMECVPKCDLNFCDQDTGVCNVPAPKSGIFAAQQSLVPETSALGHFLQSDRSSLCLVQHCKSQILPVCGGSVTNLQQETVGRHSDAFTWPMRHCRTSSRCKDTAWVSLLTTRLALHLAGCKACSIDGDVSSTAGAVCGHRACPHFNTICLSASSCHDHYSALCKTMQGFIFISYPCMSSTCSCHASRTALSCRN